MDVCKKCSDNYFVNNKYSLCKLCNGKYHLSCVSLKDSWIKALDNVNIFWVCDSCVDKMNAAVDYVNSEGSQNTAVPQEDIKHLVREKDLLQKLVNMMEYTINLPKEVIASLNDGSLKSNNSAGNKPVLHLKILQLTLQKWIRSAIPNPDISKPRAGNIIQAKDVKNAIALAEDSLSMDTNKPPTLKDGYQGNTPGGWTQIVRKKKKSSMRPRPVLIIVEVLGNFLKNLFILVKYEELDSRYPESYSSSFKVTIPLSEYDKALKAEN
ncbi:hypothetical protein WA026_019073 [Henosepilachna vigintioctopunctata]|uniref:PHD-type domain-containing protein n=1 Tax=Henosepilachna vigintioctopunctata TaxID=420089 RepID=A0AAW1V979_9CUCU